jgi:hypothetical protein
MERILALQALSTTVSFNDDLLEGSDQSNGCSSESKGGCSSQSYFHTGLILISKY